MSAQASLGLDGPATAPISEERRAQYDVDRTPIAIPRLAYDSLAPDMGLVQPPRVLCPAAGSGPWAQAARERWPRAEITAVEIREEEQPILARWCDHVITADIRDARLSGPYDVIADNPPFSLSPPNGGRKSQAEALRAFVVNLRPLLAPGGILVLYWLSDLGQRATGEAARALWDANQPLYQMRVQPVEHRKGRRADLRSCSVWCWASSRDACPACGSEDTVPTSRGTGCQRCGCDWGTKPPGWRTWDLPPLTKAERRA